MSKKRKPAIALEDQIRWTFEDLQKAFQEAGYELIIRRPVSKDLVAFDYALLFTAKSDDIIVYVDEDLKQVIKHLLEMNAQVIIKSNWLSPDTVAIQVPYEALDIMPVEAIQDILRHDSDENVPE